MQNDLERTILRTVSYFSFFSYPLTAFEIWKWQLSPVTPYSLHLVMEALASPSLQEKLVHRHGHYTLASRSIEDCLEQRHDRFLNAIAKYKKLARVLKYLARIPYIEGVAMCNSLVFHHTQPRSDIDLFIITKPGRVWSSRLLSVLPLMLVRQRPGEAKQDPVDISFFVGSDVRDFQHLRIKPHDPYMAVWLASLVPVFERESGLFARLQKENAWAHKVVPNISLARRAKSARFSHVRVRVPMPISERFAKRVSVARFPADIMNMANRDTRVIVRPYMLKFHKNDRREQIAAELEKHERTYA